MRPAETPLADPHKQAGHFAGLFRRRGRGDWVRVLLRPGPARQPVRVQFAQHRRLAEDPSRAQRPTGGADDHPCAACGAGVSMTPHIDVGQRAPDFELPAADRDGLVSLAQYRGTSSVLFALFRGLYCPFCRHQMAKMSPAADRLRAMGIETIGVVATAPDRARLYFRRNPSRFPLGADPDLVTHRAYGLPVIERNEEAGEMVERAAQRLAGELGIQAPPGQGRVIVDAADGFERLESDAQDRLRHQIQLIGQFLIDRDGVIRWCRTEDRVSYALFPSTQELLSLAERLA
jgi:peroxiredoxin